MLFISTNDLTSFSMLEIFTSSFSSIIYCLSFNAILRMLRSLMSLVQFTCGGHSYGTFRIMPLSSEIVEVSKRQCPP